MNRADAGALMWALANPARAFLRPGAVRGCARKSVPENRRAQFGTCSPSTRIAKLSCRANRHRRCGRGFEATSEARVS